MLVFSNESIEKLSEFTEFVESLPKEFTLSRGQAGGYDLLPSSLRLDKSNIRKYSRTASQYLGVSYFYPVKDQVNFLQQCYLSVIIILFIE